MKRLSKVVNIVPVIAKADTLTLEERVYFKQRVGLPASIRPSTERGRQTRHAGLFLDGRESAKGVVSTVGTGGRISLPYVRLPSTQAGAPGAAASSQATCQNHTWPYRPSTQWA